MTHQIQLNPFIEWQQEQTVTYASDSKSKKVLKCTLMGGFQVWHKGEMVLQCMQPFQAVEKYNSI